MICNDDNHSTSRSSLISTRRVPAPTVVVGAEQMMGLDGSAAAVASLDTYLHALRRNWFWCLLLGGVFAIAAAAAVMLLVPKRYTASAELRAHSAPQQLIADGNPAQREKFETYMSNVKQLLKSRSVLMRTLARVEVKDLGIVRREAADPEGWLADELKISNPRDSEVLIVSLTVPAVDDKAREEAKTVVAAVVDEYLTSIDEKERKELDDKLKTLEGFLEKKSAEERQARAELEQLADAMGHADKDSLSLEHQINMEQARLVKRELVTADIALKQAETDLAFTVARLQNLESQVIPAEELAVLVALEPRGRLLQEELNYLTNAADSAGKMTKQGDAAAVAGLGGVIFRVNELQNEIKSLKETLAMQWKIEQRKELEAARQEKEAMVKILGAQLVEWEKEYKNYDGTMKNLGKKFADIDLRRKSIDRLATQIDDLAQEVALTNIQLESRPRLEIISPAETPKSPNQPIPPLLAAAAGIFAFVLPGAGLLFWDIRSQRINSADEVSERLGLPIMGSVPILPARVTRRLGSSNGRGRWWQSLLSESIAGIRANLLREDDVRVVMVTSAVGGEGKTTVATQLAMSLARAGKRTALVDFDLPRPSVSAVFNLDIEPGVCDILRGDCEIADVVNNTVLPNLYVLPAGVADGGSIQAMNSLELPELIHDLREQFEYVIVDGSPLVPVADARVVGRYVDGAICCVLRDVSRLSMVRRASDILETFGVRLLGTVVTASQESYYVYRQVRHDDPAVV